MTDEEYFDTKQELLSNAIVSQANPNSICMHRVIQRAVRANLSSIELAQAFHCACLLLEARWPSKRKIRNIVLGNWPEFDSLHSHAHELTDVFVEHDRSRITGMSGQNELLNDTYIRILVQSTWYAHSHYQTTHSSHNWQVQCPPRECQRRSELDKPGT